MDCFIGLDLGTSSVKAVAIDGAGRTIGAAHAPYATNVPRPGWAEQDPADWSRAAHRAMSTLALHLPEGAHPRALALSGQLPTLAVLDDVGKSLHPAIVWYDGRAEEQAQAMLRGVAPECWYRRSGIILDAHYLAPMYAWVREHAPLPENEHHVCGAKDALLHALTGTWLSDPSTASGYGVFDPRTGDWDAGLCRAANLPTSLLPALRAPWEIAGHLRPEWAATGLPAGLPVMTGAGDALAGVLGCGAAVPGVMTAILGTSTAMLVSSAQPSFDPARCFLLTPHAVPDSWGLEMDLLATGSALQWLTATLGLPSPAALTELAATARPGARGLVAVPYLAGGEQGALWEPHVPAAFVGLALAHGPADLARALLEGIAFEMRRCLLAWQEAGVPVHEVVLAGAAAEAQAPLIAAVLDRPVRVSRATAASAYGAALLAGIGMGVWTTDAALALARRDLGQPMVAPPGEAARHAALYERYDHVAQQMRRVFAP